MIRKLDDGTYQAEIHVEIGQFQTYPGAAAAIQEYYRHLAGDFTAPMFCPCCGALLHNPGEENEDQDESLDWLDEGRC